MFIQPVNGNSIQAPSCQYCACHWEFRKMNKTVVIREIKIQWVQTFTYMIDYLINFNHFTHIPLVLIYLHLQFLIFKWVPLCHMATFPLPLFSVPAFFKNSVPASSLWHCQNTHSPPGKSGRIRFRFVTHTLCEDFAAGIEINRTVGQIFRKSCATTLRTICSFKQIIPFLVLRTAMYVHSSKVRKYKIE